MGLDANCQFFVLKSHPRSYRAPRNGHSLGHSESFFYHWGRKFISETEAFPFSNHKGLHLFRQTYRQENNDYTKRFVAWATRLVQDQLRKFALQRPLKHPIPFQSHKVNPGLTTMSPYQQQHSERLVQQASHELEQLRKAGSCQQFPSACRRLLRSLPGNLQCADCGAPSPEWASVTFGSLYCLICSGNHRSYGVNTSVVRSVDMDDWTHAQVLSVLEGGNQQLEGFFDRHSLGQQSEKASCRYHTKAARFYKKHLRQHVELVVESGAYRGREASRRLQHTKASDRNMRPVSTEAPLQQPISVQ